MALDHASITATGMTVGDLSRNVINDIQEVFSTMVGMDDLRHLPLQTEHAGCFENWVTAMVGLGGAYNGIVSIHAPRNLAMSFTSGMLGLEVEEVNEDVHDALGEIANMIAGSFKQHLSIGGNDIKLSIPSVITGKDYYISAGCPDDTMTLGFFADNDCFLVSAVLEME